MRFMVLVKANADSEAGVMPDTGLLAAMGQFNEELVSAGVMVAGEGLHPSSKGARMRFSEGKPTVTCGPFAPANELVAGFWLVELPSLDAAIERFMGCPMQHGAELEIRPVFGADDFGAEMTPELREQEERMRAAAAEQQR